MHEAGKQPGATPRLDPLRVARRLRLLVFLATLVALALFVRRYDVVRVPIGMNTVPSMPPDSLCLVDTRPSLPSVGSHVFVTDPNGVLLLTRVVRCESGGLYLENPNAAAAWLDSRHFGLLPVSAVRSTVLVAFPAESAAAAALPSHGK